jgi:predicted MPP superfamily phosphohydrolase
MPKALILADLHLDRWQAAGIDPLADADLSDLDLLIIAGDLSNKGHLRWKDALEVIGRKIDLDRVHVGPGNHDYYGGRIDREDKLRAAAEAAGAHFLQKSELRLDGMRFLYCTLWTDMRLGGSVEDLNRFQAERIMNDYAAIRVEQEGYRKLRAHHTCEIHRDHVAWLSARLAEPPTHPPLGG